MILTRGGGATLKMTHEYQQALIFEYRVLPFHTFCREYLFLQYSCFVLHLFVAPVGCRRCRRSTWYLCFYLE